MDIQVDRKADKTTWILGQQLTIYEIQELHEQALNALPETSQLLINGEAIEDIDTAGLQWFLAIQKWARSNGIDLLLELDSDCVSELLDLYDAYKLVGLPAIMVMSKTADGDVPHA